jgi:aminoglycoside phosphotransferase (APT) family kinase protein
MVGTLAELHAVDFRAIGLGGLGHPETYVERQVAGWRGRYDAARTHDLADLDGVGTWLAARRPALQRPTLVHNDFKLDNLVLDPGDLTRIVAVLDWEMATIGDPLADLGTALAYWIDPDDPEELRSLQFTAVAPTGFLSRARVVAEYARLTGLDPSDIVFYYALALYKVAVIGQQLYYRFALGATRDRRFESLPAAIRALAAHAARAIQRDSL